MDLRRASASLDLSDAADADAAAPRDVPVIEEISETTFVLPRLDAVGDRSALNLEASASSCVVAPPSLSSGEAVVSVSGTSDN